MVSAHMDFMRFLSTPSYILTLIVALKVKYLFYVC